MRKVSRGFITRAEREAMALAGQVWHNPDAKAKAPEPKRSPRWYVIQAVPQRETMAAAHLIGYNFTCYLPCIKERVQTGRCANNRLKAMFPGYLFAHLDLSVDRFDRIRDLPGIQPAKQAFLRVAGGDFAVLSEADRLYIRQEEELSLERARKGELPFKRGEHVRVTEGPLTDMTGVIDRLDDAARIGVLMDMLGRSTLVELDASSLESQ